MEQYFTSTQTSVHIHPVTGIHCCKTAVNSHKRTTIPSKHIHNITWDETCYQTSINYFPTLLLHILSPLLSAWGQRSLTLETCTNTLKLLFHTANKTDWGELHRENETAQSCSVRNWWSEPMGCCFCETSRHHGINMTERRERLLNKQPVKKLM